MREDVRPLPSAELLRSIFDYNAETGELRWKRKTGATRRDYAFNNRCGGKIAGSITNGRSKYLVVQFRTEEYRLQVGFYAHRIIWKMVTGRDPPEFIDHRNGDKLDNRWANLREATNGENIRNSVLRKDNKTGVKGICWDAHHKKWCAQISVAGRQRRIGRFDKIDDAREAIIAARKELHGEFARFI